MNLRFSNHKSKHENEKWNQVTVRERMDNHEVENLHFIQGNTADIMYGYFEGDCIGLILSKRMENGQRVIITGFQAPESYWKSV